jgi:hypothetical protein
MMSRKFLILLAVLIGLGGLAMLVIHLFLSREDSMQATEKDELERRKALGMSVPAQDATTKPIPASHSIRLAIGGLGLANDDQNGRLSDLLTADLQKAKGVEVVERQALDKVLREIEMSRSAMVRSKDAIRAGKLLRADWFLLGTRMSTNKANSIVVRVVDARTGIFRDTTVISTSEGLQTAAKELAEFVVRCRSDATKGYTSVYLALGELEDVSLNNRLADLPAQLRAYLTAAYRGGNIRMLERDHVETLLREINLDMAGLTEFDPAKGGAVMQTAFWLLEGDYQAMEGAKPEAEFLMKVRRIYAYQTRATVRQAYGESFFLEVKRSLDKIMSERREVILPTLVSESRAHFSRGKELAPVKEFYEVNTPEELTPLTIRQRRKMEEAIRAFQTVMLLEPTNREAMVRLGICYCKPGIDRMEEGRNLFWSVMEQPIDDAWRGAAMRRLAATFDYVDGAEKLEWFSRAEKQTSIPALRDYYHTHAEDGRTRLTQGQASPTQRNDAAEKKLYESIRASYTVLTQFVGTVQSSVGIAGYVYSATPDPAQSGEALAGLMPRLMAEFPSLAPHLAAESVEYQRQKNSPLIAEFRRQLDWCRRNPEKLFAPGQFWGLAKYGAYRWSIERDGSELAVEVLEGLREAAQRTNAIQFDDRDKIAIAYAYKATGRWQEALATFESYSNLPVMISSDGPWGKGFHPVVTSREVAICREKLGLPVIRDPREFEIGTNGLRLRSSAAFAPDQDGLWLAVGDRLIHTDFGLQTNAVKALSGGSWSGINCLAIVGSSIWVGTEGTGLFEFDRSAGRLNHYTERDGMMANNILSLSPDGNRLWIGFGVKERPGYDSMKEGGGGLGWLDLSERQFHALIPTLQTAEQSLKDLKGPEPFDIPTRRSIRAIALGTDGDVWFAAKGSPLRKFQSQKQLWQVFPEVPTFTLVGDTERLFVGSFNHDPGPPNSGPLGVSFLTFSNGGWSQVQDFGRFRPTSVTTLTVDVPFVWVGGFAYIAKIDPVKNELVRFAEVPSATVESIKIGGGFVWAVYDGQLHRGPIGAN